MIKSDMRKLPLLAFLFVPIVILDKGNLFTAMNMIPKNIMACDISDRLHRKGLSGNLNFVAFHYLLDRSADVTHPCINASMLLMYQLDSFERKFALSSKDLP